MKKSLVFTKSIAFEKNLIDRLEDHLSVLEKEGKKINFSAEVTSLIEAGLIYRQLEQDLRAGRRPRSGEEAVITTGKAKLKDLIKEKIEFGESALEPPKPVRGIRLQKL